MAAGARRVDAYAARTRLTLGGDECRKPLETERVAMRGGRGRARAGGSARRRRGAGWQVDELVVRVGPRQVVQVIHWP